MTKDTGRNSRQAQPLLSVVVPARDEERDLPHLLNSLKASIAFARKHLHEDFSYEVVVVDNRSADSTREIATNEGCLVVPCNAKNLSVTRNRGVRATSGEIIVTIDADSLFKERTIHDIIATMRTGKIAGGGCLIYPERYSPGIVVTFLLVYAVIWTYRINVGCFFFQRTTFEKIGGFNEQLVSAEDIDFGRRLRRHGIDNGLSYAHLWKNGIITSCRKFDRFGDWYFLLRPGLVIKLLKGKSQAKANQVWYDFPHE
jgi:glycosyltransferase involved in cell wall biosynthesis